MGIGKDILKVGGSALAAYTLGELLESIAPTNISEAIDVAKDLSVVLLARKGLQNINHAHLNGSNITDKVIDAAAVSLFGIELLDDISESYTLKGFREFLGLKPLGDIVDTYKNKFRLALGLFYLIRNPLAEAYEDVRDRLDN